MTRSIASGCPDRLQDYTKKACRAVGAAIVAGIALVESRRADPRAKRSAPTQQLYYLSAMKGGDFRLNRHFRGYFPGSPVKRFCMFRPPGANLHLSLAEDGVPKSLLNCPCGPSELALIGFVLLEPPPAKISVSPCYYCPCARRRWQLALFSQIAPFQFWLFRISGFVLRASGQRPAIGFVFSPPQTT